MAREKFHPDTIPAPNGPYSPAIRVGDLLYISGQVPFGPDRKIPGDTFADQARAVFDKLELIAASAGTSLKNAVKIGAYLRSAGDFESFNDVMKEYVSEPYPARTTVVVLLNGFDVEIDAVVHIP